MDKSYEYFMNRKADDIQVPLGIDEEESDFDEELVTFETSAPPLTKEKLEEINRNWTNEFGEEVDIRSRESRVTFPPDEELTTIVLFKRESNCDTEHGWCASETEFSPSIGGDHGSNFNIAEQISNSITTIKNITPIESTTELPVFDQSDLFQIDPSNDIPIPNSSSSDEDDPHSINFEPKSIHQILEGKEDIFTLDINEGKASESSHSLSKSSSTKIRHPFLGSCLNNTSLLTSYSITRIEDTEPVFTLRRPSTASSMQMQRMKSSENLASLNGNGKTFEMCRPINSTSQVKWNSLKEEHSNDWIKFEEPQSAAAIQGNPEEKLGLEAQGEAVLFTQRKSSPLRKSSSLDNSSWKEASQESNNVLAEDQEIRAVIRGVFNPKTLTILQKLPKSPKLIALAKDQIGRRHLSSQLLESIFTPKFSHFLVEREGPGFLGESKWATESGGVRPTSAYSSSTSLEKLTFITGTGSGDKYCQKSAGSPKYPPGKKKSLSKKMKQNSIESDEPTSSSLSSKSPTSEQNMNHEKLLPDNRDPLGSAKEKKPLKSKQKSNSKLGVGSGPPNSIKTTDFASVFKYISTTSPTRTTTTNESIDRLLRATLQHEMKGKPRSAKKTQFSNTIYPDQKQNTLHSRPLTANAAMDPEKWITRAIAKTHKAEETLLKKIKSEKHPRLMDAYKVYFNPKRNAPKVVTRPATSPRI